MTPKLWTCGGVLVFIIVLTAIANMNSSSIETFATPCLEVTRLTDGTGCGEAKKRLVCSKSAADNKYYIIGTNSSGVASCVTDTNNNCYNFATADPCNNFVKVMTDTKNVINSYQLNMQMKPYEYTDTRTGVCDIVDASASSLLSCVPKTSTVIPSSIVEIPSI
jgi:hypothetical protein